MLAIHYTPIPVQESPWNNKPETYRYNQYRVGCWVWVNAVNRYMGLTSLGYIKNIVNGELVDSGLGLIMELRLNDTKVYIPVNELDSSYTIGD